MTRQSSTFSRICVWNPAAPPMLTLKSTIFFPFFYRIFLNQPNLTFNNQLRQTFSFVWIVFFGVVVALSPP